MISASHNAFADNGIKLFGPDGYKLSDATEAAIERSIEKGVKLVAPREDRPGPPHRRCPRPLHPSRQVDVPRAASARRPQDRRRLRKRRCLPCGTRGALGTRRGRHPHRREPDGLNINADCGSTHPAVLQETVVASGAHIGIALDGDADRLIVVDEKGRIIDGDQMMALVALDLARRGELRGGVGRCDGHVQPRA